MKKILIIEDDLDTLNIIEYMVQDINYEVISFQKLIPVADVIAIKPGIVLVDYRLPNGRGSDFCLEIKTHPKLTATKVIMMSTHNQLKNLAKESCADAYLEKPFNIDDLTNLIQSF